MMGSVVDVRGIPMPEVLVQGPGPIEDGDRLFQLSSELNMKLSTLGDALQGVEIALQNRRQVLRELVLSRAATTGVFVCVPCGCLHPIAERRYAFTQLHPRHKETPFPPRYEALFPCCRPCLKQLIFGQRHWPDYDSSYYNQSAQKIYQRGGRLWREFAAPALGPVVIDRTITELPDQLRHEVLRALGLPYDLTVRFHTGHHGRYLEDVELLDPSAASSHRRVYTL